jgi:hypothetical protein
MTIGSISGSIASPSGDSKVIVMDGRKDLNVRFSITNGTMVVRESFDEGVTWQDVQSFTESIRKVFVNCEADTWIKLTLSGATVAATYRLSY